MILQALLAAAITLLLTVAITRTLRALAIREIARRRGGLAQPGVRAPLFTGAFFVIAVAVFAAGLTTGRPILGLGVIALFPFFLPHWLRMRRARLVTSLDASAISYLHALRGLIAVGESLPSALFRLSATVDAPFAATLGGFLESYEGGKSLRQCLERFRARSELRVTGLCLAMLEMAYAQGLAVAPLLDRMLPILEREHGHRARIAKLRGATAVQLMIAAGVPIVLALAMNAFQPATLEGFAASPAFYPILAGAFAIEAVGVGVIWKISAFY